MNRWAWPSRAPWAVVLTAFYALAAHFIWEPRFLSKGYPQGWYESGFASRDPLLWTLLLIGILAWVKGKGHEWREHGGTPFKILAMVSLGVLAAYFTTTAGNWYFGHSFWADRLLLAGLVLTSFVSPLIYPAALLSLLAFMGQFHHPVGGFSISDQSLPLYLSSFCATVILINPIPWKKAAREGWWLVAMAIVAGHYLTPALQKISIGTTPIDWILNEDLSCMLHNSTAKGWLPHLGELREPLLSFLRNFSSPLASGALALEFGVILLASKRWRNPILVALIGMHGVIFTLSGILFWKWICVLLAILALARITPSPERGDLFIGTATTAILCLTLLFPRLGWFSLPLVERFDLVVVDTQGREHMVDKHAMAPYDMLFTFHRLRFLLPEHIEYTPLVSNPLKAEELKRAASAEEVLGLLSFKSRGAGDLRKSELLLDMLAKWRTAGGDYSGILPHHLYGNQPGWLPSQLPPGRMFVRYRLIWTRTPSGGTEDVRTTLIPVPEGT